MAHFGYDQGIFAGVLISPDFLAIFPETKDPSISGITSSCFSLGAFFGCVASFLLGDRLGRKKSVYVGLAVNVLGVVLQIAAYHLPQMIVGRILNGFGMGITSSTCPVFVAEASPYHIRGKLVVIGSLCNTVGFCLANWMNYGLFEHNGPLQWRFPLAFQLVFSLIVLISLPLTVESPRWYMLRGRFQEARATLAQLRGTDGAPNDRYVETDLRSIQEALQHEQSAHVSIVDTLLCRDPLQSLRRLVLRQVAQKAPINHGYEVDSLKLRLMMYGSIAMGSCYLIAAVTLREAKIHPEQKSALGKATVAMFFLYYFCYGTSFAKVPWVYNSEINSLGWRTRGAAAATATNWMSGFVIVQFTKVGVNNLGWGFYLLFAGFCWSYLPTVFLFYPETSNRTLEDMDEIFRDHGGILVFRDKVLTQRSRPREFEEAEQRRMTEASASAQESQSV
ncbi:general substrate transporter [Hypoxylon crocopeplum]|nr:general substrate transporter [Hypoxylon crocopeplum]